MRVLVVEPGLHDDGAARVSLDRAARWARGGAQVRVLALSHDHGGSPVEVPAPLRLELTTAHPERFRRRAPASVEAVVRAARGADVVVAGREIGDGLLLAALGARLARRPLAVTVQSSLPHAVEHHVPRRLQPLTRRVLRSAAALVHVTAGLVPGALALGSPVERNHVVTNGVDVDGVVAGAALPPPVPLPEGPLLVASGRLSRQKGFDDLLRAHAAARREVPHRLLVLGEGPERPALEQQVEDLDLGDTVRLLGFTSRPWPVVAQADLFVSASRWEGMSLVLAEALALGIPVLATDCVSGPADVLDDGRFGALVPVGDTAALAAAVVAHLRNPQPLREAARCGALEAADRYCPDRAADEHARVLRSLLR